MPSIGSGPPPWDHPQQPQAPDHPAQQGTRPGRRRPRNTTVDKTSARLGHHRLATFNAPKSSDPQPPSRQPIGGLRVRNASSSWRRATSPRRRLIELVAPQSVHRNRWVPAAVLPNFLSRPPQRSHSPEDASILQGYTPGEYADPDPAAPVLGSRATQQHVFGL